MSKTSRESVTKEVRSILLASQRGMSCREFVREWNELLGYPIPHRQLGFASLEDFLRGLPEVVELSWQDGELILKAVANEATRHIARMVSVQKPSKKPKRQMRRPPPSRRYAPPPVTQRRTVNPFLRGQILQLLNAFPHGLLGSNFLLAFSRKFGRNIAPSALGFQSVNEFLQSMPDILRFENLSSGGYKVFPLNGQQTHAFQQTRQNNTQGFGAPTPQQDRAEVSQSCREVSPPRRRSGYDDDFDVCEDDDEEGAVVLMDDHSGLAGDIKANIRKVLSRFPAGMRCLRFTQQYKSMIGQELDYQQYGFYNLVGLMSTIPDVVKVEKISANDWLLSDARIKGIKDLSDCKTSLSASNVSRSSDLQTAPPIPEEIQEKIRQVVLQFPNGLPLSNLQQNFEDLVGEALNYVTLGYKSIDAMIRQMETKVTMRNYVLFPANDSDPFREDFLLRKQIANQPRLPSDAVGSGNAYRPQPLPGVDHSFYVDVFVSMVESPSCLWVQLGGRSTTGALDDLMDDLDYFYNSASGENYSVPDGMLQKGLACVAVFSEDGNWHRVTISDVPDGNFVKAFFVDYGGFYNVNRAKLRLLRTRFMKLPSQAIRAKLACIEPLSGSNWSAAANKVLLQLVSNKPLKAMVDNVDNMGVLSLLLCDVSDPSRDVHVNDELVERNLAAVLTAADEITDVPEEIAETPEIQSEEMKNEGEEVDEGEYRPTNIQFVELTDDYTMHIIRLNDRAWVTSHEISLLLWKKDLLNHMLDRSKLRIKSVEITYEEHNELFDEFIDYHVPGCKDGDGKPKDTVTLYPLESVKKILENFNHPSKDLLKAIEEEVDYFDPEDPYWMGEEESESDSDDEHSISDLELAFNVLQMKRKKTIDGMNKNPVLCDQYVDSLALIEKQMQDIKERIVKAKRLLGEAPSRETEPVAPSKNISLPSRSAPVSMANVQPVAPMLAPQQASSPPSVPPQSNPATQQQLMEYQKMLMAQLANIQSMMGQASLNSTGIGRGMNPLFMNPAFAAMNPGMPTMNSAMPAMNPALAGMNPGMPTMNSAMPAMNPAMPTMNPTMPACDPSQLNLAALGMASPSPAAKPMRPPPGGFTKK
ncbi:hypothetical protein CAPTEDRAFT_218952 [Capitella teleta]|uniref:Tudor domain-containing protein 5 n=1 Tax=Capitella teleta TaxID=283909 RepID=R7UJX3_CAPTE|nr:hypothetical protein CAPTEDRAFT_218952 [Capitella teleta]|eukprot:ELU03562.1 hypothetical protein CAPTEDRAFT_218952 [Capitella teleta]